MLTYRLDPLSNPNSPIVCHRTEKTRCMAVRGGKEEPDGGIRRPTCERGGCYGVFMSAFLSWRGEYAGQGHLVHSQLVATLGQGAGSPHPYTDGKDTYFSASCQIFLLYFVFWQGILTGLPIFSQPRLSIFPAQDNICQCSLPIDNLCFSKIIT